MYTLGIESSCDETSAAVVDRGLRVRSNVVFSQVARHERYGGVVPELASRCHVEVMEEVVRQAMEDARAEWADIGRIAFTRGPGLASSLLAGIHTATALSLSLDRPRAAVHHLVGHVYSLFLDRGRLGEDLLPMMVLLVSGGHTQILMMDRESRLTRMGGTLDDAAGEALDKGAKLMGLGYPGGPRIEKTAELHDGPSIRVTGRRSPLKASARTGGLDPEFCFSFSGLKTALLYHVRDHPEDAAPDRLPALCAGFQEDVFDGLTGPLRRALQTSSVRSLGCVGGVLCNQRLRLLLEQAADEAGVNLFLTDPAYCTDNAAMIAAAAACGACQEIPPGATEWLDAKPSWLMDHERATGGRAA